MSISVILGSSFYSDQPKEASHFITILLFMFLELLLRAKLFSFLDLELIS